MATEKRSGERAQKKRKARARGRRRDLVGDLLSRRRPRRARLLRLRHPRPRALRDLRRGLLPALASPAAVARRARRPAVAAGGGAAAARGDHPPDAQPAAGGRHGRAADARRRRSRTTTREANDASPQAQYRKAVRLTAQTGTIVATWGRLQAGGGPIAPDPAMGQAANFLYMLTGDRPNALAVQAFDVALTLHADHELNASTFAARVAAATLTDIYSAVVAAIGALKGPLHGGANAEVMKMLLELGRDRQRRPHRRLREGQVRAQGEDLRASAIASTRPKTRAPRTCGRCRRTSGRRAGQPGLVRHVAAHRGAGEEREEAVPERRLLLGVDVLHARASRSTSTRRSSPSAACRAGPRTSSSSTRTTA